MCSSSPTIDRWLHAESDAAALDLIGAVLQDVPQIILQLYLLAHILLATSLDQYSSFFGPLSFDTEMTFGSLFLDRKFTDLNTNSFNESKALGYEYFSGDYKVEDFDDLFNLKTMNTSHSTNANQNTDYVLERTLNSSSVNHTTIENAYYSASYSLISNYTLHSLSVNGTESSPITGYLASSKTDEEEKGQLIVPAELQPDTARHLSEYEKVELRRQQFNYIFSSSRDLFRYIQRFVSIFCFILMTYSSSRLTYSCHFHARSILDRLK